MCGIVGIAGPHDPSWLGRMDAVLTHRGPDDHGAFHDPAGPVSLAVRRLSILDLEHGHQPMSNEDGNVWVVFNGEIYNSPELRTRLEARGCSATITSAHRRQLHLSIPAGAAA